MKTWTRVQILAPKYTEVNATMAATDTDPKPSRSVEFGHSVFS